jgi:arylsulfatase A
MRIPAVLVLAMLATIASHACADQTARRANIVVIVVDDFGYETVGANGGTSYKTPHFDRIAAKGVRFTQCYLSTGVGDS